MKKFLQRCDAPNSTSYVGKGKLAEIKDYVDEHEVNLVIFDDDLSPKQIAHIQKETKVKVLDRTSLILDIFARRAQTANAKMQVELAQYQYLLPRLTGMWTRLNGLNSPLRHSKSAPLPTHNGPHSRMVATAMG